LEEKQRIVAESYGGATIGVGDGAAQRVVLRAQLFTWRRLAREGRLSGDAVPALVPVEIAFTPAPAPTCAPPPPSCAASKGRNNRDRAWRRLSRARLIGRLTPKRLQRVLSF